jgi:hypothetical protein
MWDWGDGSKGDWVGPYDAGEPCTAEHAWTDVGDYDVMVKTKDMWDAESDWSAPLTVSVQCCRSRGNINGDEGNQVNVSDLSFLVDFLFRGGSTPPCADESDVNGDGGTNVSDLSFLVEFLFRGGNAPAVCN